MKIFSKALLYLFLTMIPLLLSANFSQPPLSAPVTYTTEVPFSQMRRFHILNDQGVHQIMANLLGHIGQNNVTEIRKLLNSMSLESLMPEIRSTIVSESFLQVVVMDEDKKMMKLFRDFGADINVNHIPTQLTALHFFVASLDEEGVKYLLEQKEIDVNSRDHLGNTPLHYSVAASVPPFFDMAGTPERNILRNLVKRDDLEINAKNNVGWTALLVAVQGRNIGATKILLSNKKTDRDARDHLGWNSLHLATYQEDKEMVKLLLKHGINPNEKAGDRKKIHELTKNKDILKLIEAHLQRRPPKNRKKTLSRKTPPNKKTSSCRNTFR